VATDAYTYLHVTLVAGIVITALGIEQAIGAVDSPEPIGRFTAVALAGGVSLYLAGTAFVWRRVSGEWAVVRLAGASAVALSVLLLTRLPALPALAVTVVLVVALIVVEQLLGQRAKVGSRPAVQAKPVSKPAATKPAPIRQPSAPSAGGGVSGSSGSSGGSSSSGSSGSSGGSSSGSSGSSISGLLDRDDNPFSRDDD
jgi:uncharacterized membrane protein YgcG